MNNDWIKIYTATLAHKAEIVKAVLEENDIESVIVNKTDSSYPGIIGHVEVYVPMQHEVLAQFIIKQNEL
jgi:Putative prokaryotic signal transducing protein